MQITDVRIRKMNDASKLKAIVSITLNDVFVVHDIKIIEGMEGLFVAMPSRKVKDGEFKDIAHPLDSQTRSILCNAIFNEYNKALNDAI